MLLPQQWGTPVSQSHLSVEDLCTARLGSPAGTGEGNSVTCTHVGLSPGPLDVVTTVQGLLPLRLLPQLVHGAGEAPARA